MRIGTVRHTCQVSVAQIKGRHDADRQCHEGFAWVRAALIEAARDRRLLTYQDVADIMGYSGKGVEWAGQSGRWAMRLTSSSTTRAARTLSALIVKSGSRMPGEGFYLVAIELGARAVASLTMRVGARSG